MPVGSAEWVAIAQGVTPAAAGTAKTMLNVIAAANRTFKVAEIDVSFVAATSGAAKPVLVELCTSTQGGAGSGSSAVTPAPVDVSQDDTVQASANKGYTSEPTTLTVVRTWRVHPQTRLGPIQFPLGREARVAAGKGMCIRVTFDTGETTLNTDCYIDFEE